jgi:antitoxin (DNA-binding transcriptional repressor) of toxin-antitoxin stability system
MMEFNIHETKTRLSELLQYVEQGETVIIANAGKPVAQITKFVGAVVERTPGRLRKHATTLDMSAFEDADAEVLTMFGFAQKVRRPKRRTTRK